MIRVFLVFCISAMIMHAPAQAAWHEASSDHFLIYSDQKESDIRAFAERLERYHDAMRFLFNRPTDKPSPSNRVTIYAVNSARYVRELAGEGSKYLQGFYVPRAGGSLAVIPEVKAGRYELSESESVLLHEYAHHFLLSVSARAYPLWFSEGYAEFFGTAKFGSDGSVGLGLSSKNRAYELALAKDVPIEMLLDTQAYQANKSKRYDSFYGQSWALYHMLHFFQERKGQLEAYLLAMAKGQTEMAAAAEAFGDISQLDKDLSSYLRKRKILTYNIPPDYLKTGEINIRPLNAAEAEIMPVRIRSKRGVDEEQATALLPEARAVGAKYPNDPFVQAALAEAEFDAGNDKEAVAAADRAIAANPRAINAHIQKGYALARMAPDAEEFDAAWEAVRGQFVKVNRIENDNPIPLMQFYMSYRGQGITPPEIAVQGLQRALELAPYDPELRWMNANQYMADRKYAWAAATLGPLANNPHPSSLSEMAQTLMKEAEAKAAQATNAEKAAD
ncbi:MAG: DUF1570 domain-containing protein [Parasphingorhabdus sp.]